MNSLEALEKMFYGVGSEKENNENYMIIYKELERLEELKQLIKTLKDVLDLKIEMYHKGGYTLNYKGISNCMTSYDRCLKELEVEQYNLLKKYLGKEQ